MMLGGKQAGYLGRERRKANPSTFHDLQLFNSPCSCFQQRAYLLGVLFPMIYGTVWLIADCLVCVIAQVYVMFCKHRLADF